MYSAPTLLLALAAFVGGVAGFGTSDAVSRREAFASVLAGSVAIPAILVAAPDEAGAFANKISDKYADKPKRRGPKPKDLGVAKRVDMGGDEYMGLKNCGPAPNCFCSTDNPDDEPEHVIPAWSWPKGYDRVGYLDFGVNAKRLNYLAKALREKGWNAEGVDLKTTHVDYATQNGLA